MKKPEEHETSPSVTQSYASGRLARNTIHSLIGQILPLPVAILAIPYLIDGIGTDRFGVLTIAWIVVGYFSLFDMGIGKATTKVVAELSARGESRQLRDTVLSSFIILGVLGVLAGTLLALVTGWLVSDVLNIPPTVNGEARTSFYFLATAIPVVLLIAGARGVLEAQQQFRTINFIKIPSAIASYIVPLLVLPFSRSLVPMVAMLSLAKLISLIFYLHNCRRCLPASESRWRVRRTLVGRLVRFGGWLSITNFIAPLISYADRFFIGSIITMTALTYYATPYDVMARVFIIPTGILAVMFPAFSAFSATDRTKLSQLYYRTTKYILFIMTPIAVAVIVYAQPLLQLWLGQEFAQNSSLVVQILATGVLFSSVARIPLSATQAMGRPDISAKFYLIELPLVILGLYLITGPLGIAGVAAVWLARIVTETVFMFYHAEKMLGAPVENAALSGRGTLGWIAAVSATAWASSAIPAIFIRSMITVILLAAYACFAYAFLLNGNERQKIFHGWQRISSKLFRNWGISRG